VKGLIFGMIDGVAEESKKGNDDDDDDDARGKVQGTRLLSVEENE